MIRIRSLLIENLRGIREGKIHGLTDVNVLVGRNNSGKTTVVEAITRAATGGGLQQDLLGRGVEQFWQAVRGAGSQTFLSYDSSRETKVVATLCDNDRPETCEEVAFRRVPRPHKPLRHRNAQPSQEVQAFCSGVTVLRPADAFSTQIEQRFWPELLSDRRDRMLTQTLNQVFGIEAESFQLLPNSQFIVLFRDRSLPLDSQGDGTRAAMRTMMSLSMLRGTLLMLEEPECHQHPGSLERFAGSLCKLAGEQKVQLLISTHSRECAGAFMKAAGEVVSDAAVFHLTLNDGKQEARRLDPEAVETLTTTGVDVRFLDLYA